MLIFLLVLYAGLRSKLPQGLIVHELFELAQTVDQQHFPNMPLFRTQQWYFFLVSAFYLYGGCAFRPDQSLPFTIGKTSDIACQQQQTGVEILLGCPVLVMLHCGAGGFCTLKACVVLSPSSTRSQQETSVQVYQEEFHHHQHLEILDVDSDSPPDNNLLVVHIWCATPPS